ncbi:unnamed protein product [Sympodiomycopsis kandeliae]
MSDPSPWIGIALTIGLPLVIRYSSQWSPSHFKPRLQYRAALWRSPFELLTAVVVFGAVIASLAKLNPWGSSHRLARDIFRHTGLPINAKTTTLRSRLASKTLEDLGLDLLLSASEHGDDSDVQAGDLLERLLRHNASMSGRQTYLILGAEALLNCHFCKQPNDLQYFAIPALLLSYAPHFLILNILTAKAAFASSIDALVAPIWPFRSQPGASSPRTDSSQWKTPAALILFAALLWEIAIICNVVSWSADGTSVWNHWHHNIYLFRHALFLTLPAIVFAYPKTPSRSAAPGIRFNSAFVDAGRSLQQASHHVAMMNAGSKAVWSDAGLRDAVAKWHDENTAQHSQKDLPLIEAARKKGLIAENASAKVRETLQRQLAALWEATDPNSQ